MPCGYAFGFRYWIMTLRPAPFAVIDLDAFRHNFSVVKAHIPPGTEIIAVVKANAYGHGADLIAGEAERCGASILGVARSQEALELIAAGVSRPILVLGTPAYSLLEETVRSGVVHAASSIDDARAISAAASRLETTAVVHVKVDTGMSRLGLDAADAPSWIERIARLPRLDVHGIFTHLADAENPDGELSRRQVGTFSHILEALTARGIHIPLKHCANSAAVLTCPDAHFNLVRPGIMLYGYLPSETLMVPSPLRPVLSLRSAVVHLRTVEADTGVSYGHRYRTAGRTTLATVALGYGDGYSRLLTGRAWALVRGRRFPVVGTICMDLVVLDMGPDADCTIGDEVVFIGRQGGETISAWDLARILGTIPYEITTAISRRVDRYS
jgi:alanine racemase